MGCIYVNDCPDGTPCFQTERACRCGCPNGGGDPNSKECLCGEVIDTCAAPKIVTNPPGCVCKCPNTCPPPFDPDNAYAQKKTVTNSTTCECECNFNQPCPTNFAIDEFNCRCDCTILPADCWGGPPPLNSYDQINCRCDCEKPLKQCATASGPVQCIDACPLEWQAINPATCACEECAAPKIRRNDIFCCDPVPPDHVQAGTASNPCKTCPTCANGYTITNPDTCECGCNPNTHELCNGKCYLPCTNDAFERRADKDCECACPKHLLQGTLSNGQISCLPCPVDLDGEAGTHEYCNGECLPKCSPTQVRGVDCNCYCPPGKKLVVYSSSSSACVNVTYNCVNGGCVEAADDTGTYDTLTECTQACTTQCFPVPTPPPGTPILCPDGVTQLGLITYPIFDSVTCTWTPAPIYWGITCPGDQSSGGGGGESSGTSNCCNLANPGPAIFGDVCGATVPVKTTGYAAPCAGHYTNLTWCETCLNDVTPILRRVDTYIFNPNTCDFELFLPTPDIQSCEFLSSSGAAYNSSSSNQAVATSSSQSSTSSSSQSAVSHSSSSLCTVEPVSIVYGVASNGSFLNQFGPGSTARVTVLVSNLAAAAGTGVQWTLKANGVVLFGFTVAESDPNPRTFTLSAEDLLATLGLTFETAPLSSYVFDFCGEATNCALQTATTCNGRITVLVPARAQSSSSLDSGSQTSSALSSSFSGASLGSTSSTNPGSTSSTNPSSTSSTNPGSTSSTNLGSTSSTSVGSTSSTNPGSTSSTNPSSTSSTNPGSTSSTSVGSTSSTNPGSTSSTSAGSASSRSGGSSACAPIDCPELTPSCPCYVLVSTPCGCPEYLCLPDATCCDALFGQKFDGGNAATNCENNTVNLGGAAAGIGCLNCQAGNCGCEETIDGGTANGDHAGNRDCGTAAGCTNV